MKTSRRKASSIHRNVAVPLAKQIATEEFDALQGVTVISMRADALKRSHFHRDNYPGKKRSDGRWHVMGTFTATVEVSGRRFTLTLPAYSVISPDGTLDRNRLGTNVVNDIEKARRIGFQEFWFRASMRAAHIPDGMYVEVQYTNLDSTSMIVRLYSVDDGVLQQHVFPIGPKVEVSGRIEVLTGTELDCITTFTANCVKALIAYHVDGTPLPNQGVASPGQVMSVSEYARNEYNESARVMVEDFDAHADLVKTRRVVRRDAA